MAKAYWVATYRSISDPDKLAAYAKLAGPAIAAAGVRVHVRLILKVIVRTARRARRGGRTGALRATPDTRTHERP